MSEVVAENTGSVIIHSARIVDDGCVVEDGWVRFAHGAVATRGVGTGWHAHVADEIIDASVTAGPGAILTPGFIDIHSHGGAGAAHEDGADAIRAARAAHRAHGTTRAVISLVTAPLDVLAARTEAVARLAETDDDILGSHLEGPFLDPAHHGAHDPALLRDPSPDAVARLLEAGAGTVRQVTIAPELPGGLAAIGQIIAAGAVAAIGHTSADAQIAHAAFDAGATILTHAFNAMPGIHHRAPGPVLAAAADERITLEAIADGVHLHPSVIKLVFDSAPGRVALVTDAMAAACAADGHYTLGALEVTVSDGVARVDATGSIAGSTLTQDVALRRSVDAGVSLADAVRALTTTPAQAIGVADRFGSLSPGKAGDAVLLRDDLTVARVQTGVRR